MEICISLCISQSAFKLEKGFWLFVIVLPQQILTWLDFAQLNTFPATNSCFLQIMIFNDEKRSNLNLKIYKQCRQLHVLALLSDFKY